MLRGPTNSGKSFAGLDLVAHIALRRKWHGRRTRGRGGIGIVDAEGHQRNRLAAFMSYHDVTAKDLGAIEFLGQSLDLLSASGQSSLLLALEELAERQGRLCAVVIDTLAAVMAGGNENAPDDMGKLLAFVRVIYEQFECLVLLVHHSGKDENRGARGHSSLKAAVDAEIEVVENADHTRDVWLRKLRDGERDIKVAAFRLHVVDLGPTSDVDPDADEDERITSCVCEPLETSDASTVRPKGSGASRLSRTAEIALSEAAALVNARNSRSPTVTDRTELDLPRMNSDMRHVEDLRARFYLQPTGDTPEAKKKAFQRVRIELAERHRLHFKGDWFWFPAGANVP